MLKHGENIVDLMGGEIDRIEMKLRVSFAQFAPSIFTFIISTEKIPIDAPLRSGDFVRDATFGFIHDDDDAWIVT